MYLAVRSLAGLIMLVGFGFSPGLSAAEIGDQPGTAAWADQSQAGITSARGELVLNGWWRFTEAEGDGTADVSAWGWARVPGSWAHSEEWFGAPLGSLVGPAGGTWDGEAAKKIRRAWYAREITIPADWRGRSIVIRFERVSTDARVTIDGKPCGDVAWPDGEVDITSAVTPGSTHKLRVLVIAAPEQGEVKRFMETADKQVSTSAAKLYSRGLVGDVLLVSRPRSAWISDVFVQPSVRQKRITLAVEIHGLTKIEDLAVTADFCPAGMTKVEQTFSSTVRSRAADVQTLTMSWDWPAPRLWDLHQPELYDLRLGLAGSAFKDVAVQRFGFREFWIDGRDFKLNGSTIHLRPCLGGGSAIPALDEAAIDRSFFRGFNFIEIWPNDTFERSAWGGDRWLIDACDRKGMLISARAGYMNQVFDHFTEPAVRAEWAKHVEHEMRQYRNNPSVVMWGSSGNFFGHEDDLDPRHIGRSGWAEKDARWQKRAEIGRSGIAIMKGVDPTRPVFTHMGTSVGDVFTTNMYLNVIPLQEREEMLSLWAKDGNMPFMAVEFEMPIDLTLHRGRGNHEIANTSEPLATEFAAIDLGPQAYVAERPEYRSAIVGAGWKGGWQWSYGQPTVWKEPVIQQFLVDNIRGQWCAWRTAGISGGMLPWSDGHATYREPQDEQLVSLPAWQPGSRGWWRPQVPAHELAGKPRLTAAGQAFVKYNNDTLAWISGPQERFLEKDHAVTAGSRLVKSACLISDLRKTVQADLSWTAMVAGVVIGKGQAQVELPPGAVRFVPIAVTSLTAGSGEIELTARIAGIEHHDRFVFSVHPRAAAALAAVPALPPILVCDPKGQTSAFIRSLGLKAEPWQPAQRSAGLVVIGRNALVTDPLLLEPLRKHVVEGGRVLIMAQDPAFITQVWGMRVAGHLERQAFAVDPHHPIMAGLVDDDLRDWAGESRLLDPRPLNDGSDHHGPPLYGYRWGGTGAVSSAAIEVPHRAGWRPLIVTGFDLQYSPLMELDVGRGRVTLCTLDFEDHVPGDPAAARLATNVLRHAATAELAPRRPAVYVGDDAGEKLLSSTGVRFERMAAVPAGDVVVILGSGSRQDPASLAGAGRRVLVLPRVMEPGLRSAGADFAGSAEVPSWPETAGVVPGMLRSRIPVELPLMIAADGMEIAGGGLLGRVAGNHGGVALYVQADPTQLDTTRKIPLRFTSWRWTRLIAQLAANLGAACDQDEALWQDMRTLPPVRLSLANKNWRAKQTDPRPAFAWVGHGLEDPGMTDAARAALVPTFDDHEWQQVGVPGQWEHFGEPWSNPQREDGEAVFRTTVDVPPSWAGKALELCLGTIDDSDTTTVDGLVVGEAKLNYDKKRVYRIPGERVTGGKMVIAIRIWDWCGGGGFTGAAEDVELRIADVVAPPGLYHADYRKDFHQGDDPYRFTRW